MGEGTEDDYVVCMYVTVEGYGKEEHVQETMERVKRELKLAFGPVIKVDIVGVLREEEARGFISE